MLEFRGIQRTTLADYPGEIACTLFLGGCNWRCGYCYNVPLALEGDGCPRISQAEALEFLRRRRGFLDGVCVTGGEPLLHDPDLLDFLREAKSLGYKIKLDTNGAFPAALRAVIEQKLADYLAMDIKAPPEKYEQIAARKVNAEKLAESVRLIQQSGADYEFRTTVFSHLTDADFDAVGRWLHGSRRYVLQKGRLDLPLLDPSFAEHHSAPGAADLRAIAARMAPHFDIVEIRA